MICEQDCLARGRFHTLLAMSSAAGFLLELVHTAFLQNLIRRTVSKHRHMALYDHFPH